MGKNKEFDIVITPENRGGSSVISELFRYKDMMLLMLRRDIIANYKQTILGPTWAVIQPIVSAIITAFVFGGLAGLSPSGIPTFLFYMIGQVSWGFFSGSLNGSANVFLKHSGLLSKVYFPRFVMPITDVMSRCISLLIQLAIFAAFYIGFVISGAAIRPHWTIVLLPFYLAHLAVIGVGVGSILSAFTTKYRDTVFLIGYLTSFWSYLSPIVYDIGIVPERFLKIYLLNPVAPVINHIRYAVFSQGMLTWNYYFISLAVGILLLIAGYKVFNKTERTFIDTI